MGGDSLIRIGFGSLFLCAFAEEAGLLARGRYRNRETYKQ
jgi:hypothetical protein